MTQDQTQDQNTPTPGQTAQSPSREEARAQEPQAYWRVSVSYVIPGVEDPRRRIRGTARYIVTVGESDLLGATREGTRLLKEEHPRAEPNVITASWLSNVPDPKDTPPSLWDRVSEEPSREEQEGSEEEPGRWGPNGRQELESCECDNTHQKDNTVCRWCWAHGRRHWNDPEVEEASR